MSTDIDVSFPTHEYGEEVSGGKKPKPGVYYCQITQARIGVSKKNNPQIHVIAQIQRAEQGNESEIDKNVEDYIPLPYAGISEASIKKLHAFCSRLGLLPPEAWGPAAKSFKAQSIVDNAKLKLCFAKLEPDTFTNDKGKEIPTSSIEFAGWYAPDHEAVASYRWMVTGEAPPPPSNGSPVAPADDI